MESEKVIYHFSHVQPLQLNPSFQSQGAKIETQCCNLLMNNIKNSGFIELVGNFFVHKEYCELPHHNRHLSSTLTLVADLPSSSGTVSCHSCLKQVKDLFYHCTFCSYDLHTAAPFCI